MAFKTQTTQEIFDSILKFIESRINQTTPDADKAYNKVLSGFMSQMFTILLKFASDRAKEVLTISASIEGLRIIGQGRNIPEKPATSSVITFDVPAINGTTIEQTVIYTALDTGVRYRPDASVTAGISNIATITGTASTAGVVGNLIIGQELEADRQVSGAEQIGTVTGTVTIGANAEETEAYRQRLLDDERTKAAGSNSAAYRKNGEKTPGVARIFPYTGQSAYLETGLGVIHPVAITIYVKAESSVNVDGIADQPLLDLVDEYIKTDQDTQQANQVLTGDIDSLREIKSIYNTTFFVTVFGLDVSIDLESKAKEDIETAVKAYFRTVQAFILGLDFVEDKNAKITIGTLNNIVQDAAKGSGGTIVTIAFNVGAGDIPEYEPGAGELTKLADIGGITYA